MTLFFNTQDIWTTQPIAALLMFGFPLLVFTFIIYMLCIADPGPEEEDLDDMEDEGVEVMAEGEFDEKELKDIEEEVDPSTKPKKDWTFHLRLINVISSGSDIVLLLCQTTTNI